MKMLEVGQTGTASFYDGVFLDPPTVKQAATRAGATEGGRVLIGTHQRADGASYELLHEAGRVNVYETRTGSSINPTRDSRAEETAELKAINAANAAFWGRKVGR